ncbi:hypothetical protein [Corynebacterium riegelii]|uniref:hypothetical protein n=1 Tax=Corynebacterium riegelii TaxID=156976 RepID=UPI00191F394C|nr:hypothetical protein [Corynebacterium riegelii]QQU84895.1 hypothetical protein I6I71_05050 [Corynebacterium riegelii]
MQKPRASRARPGKRSASQANEYFDGHMETQSQPRNQALAAIIDAITIAGKNNVPVTDTTSWCTAVEKKVAVPGSSLVEFALDGRRQH